MTTTRTGTYQMLWDCPVCGTKKLLGVDHRHCPNCGAPQEENLRYFPSKADRVATAFRGTTPDWECQHCGTPNFADANHCVGCGAPRGASSAVHVRAAIDADSSETGEQAAAAWNQRRAAARAQQRAAHTRRRAAPGRLRQAWDQVRAWFAGIRQHPARLVVVAIAVAVVAAVSLAVCDRKVELEVSHHSWTRTIPVERYSTVSGSDWCSSTPGDARIHSRISEIHHYDKVPDGEDCRTVPGGCSQSCSNVDNGNGSFSQVCTQTCTPDRTECTTRYRDVPVYADKCYYEVDRWVQVRSAVLEGEDLDPRWPDEPSVAGCAATRLGCERIGARFGVYRVHYVSAAGTEDEERFECERDESSWRSISAGARYLGQVSRLTGALDCHALRQ